MSFLEGKKNWVLKEGLRRITHSGGEKKEAVKTSFLRDKKN